MIKRIQAHLKKKQIQARAAQPKEVVSVNKQDIARKLATYNPEAATKKANFLGPRVQKHDLEGAV